MSPRLTVKILAAAAICTAATLVLAGCGGGDSPLSVNNPPGVGSPPPITTPAPATTFLAQCVINAENDVIIGGPNAKPGCDHVVANPNGNAPPSYDEILITDGGSLTVSGAAEGSATAGAVARASIPLTPLMHPVREVCLRDGGKFVIGRKDSPVSGRKDVIEFLGNRGDNSKDSICPAGFLKGIDVLKGGILEMYGAKGVPALGGVSWTTLAAPGGSRVPGAKVTGTGPTTLYLTADVTKGVEGWEPGDWIVVATTDYDPFHSEFVQIATVKSTAGSKNGVGSIVTLMEPLKYYHFGSLPPSPADESCPDPLHATLPSAPATQPAFLCDGPDRNYGVDERAEVGLISRDIELTAATEPVTTVPPPATSSVHWGGEIAIHQGFQKVVIQGVRLSKFGKDQLGSYPIHIHMVGTVAQAPNPPDQQLVIDSDSIDHSYNKCVTIHSSANITISNLVCARIVGHIFYQELMSGPLPPGPGDPPVIPATAGTVNPALDADIVYNHDLGIGAMSNSFDIYPATDGINGQPISRQQLIDKYWWAGDYMTNAECKKYFSCIHYDGFNIPDTDNPYQSTHGACYAVRPAGSNLGSLVFSKDPHNRTVPGAPPCPKGTYYLEPASGFWIQNPGTVLTNDAIAGCQGDGVAYWWVPPNDQVKVAGLDHTVGLQFNPVGKVDNDRSSACYHGYFAEGENNVFSNQLQPLENGENRANDEAPNIIAHFTNLTATHSRWRALWLRGTATWFVVKNAHLADDNRGASLVTSGGVDGNGPGIWQLLKDSVLVGMSQDNVGRWGPCPKLNALGYNTGFDYGCIDYSYPQSGAPHSGEIEGKGYPGPDRNSYGYQIYDGPALMFHLRFVNYNHNSDPNPATDCNGAAPDPTNCAFSVELDQADRAALAAWVPIGYNGHHQYEGDAALGWFPSNQNAYPTATTTKQLQWVNSNLRHQIFTDKVNIGAFIDGDKNTAILDEDGTLSGFGVKLAANAATDAKPVHPFSLNNLPFNAISNSVDECYSRGAQNEASEGRDSSLMSPATMGTLEFGNLWPFDDENGEFAWPGSNGNTYHWQDTTFTRTDLVQGEDGPYRPTMTLLSRNGQGYWEPRVSSDYAYTVTVSPSTKPGAVCGPNNKPCVGAGIYKWIDVGVADVLDPNLSKSHPFYILLGIDYASVDASGNIVKPANNFTIKRGYKSYFGGIFSHNLVFSGTTKPNNIFQYFTLWNHCNGLDGKRLGQPPPWNVPSAGQSAGCPAGGSDKHTGTGNPPAVTTLSPSSATDLQAFTAGGVDIQHYYYNSQTGYLWLYVVQDEQNAQGPSPVGSCGKNPAGGKADPACPWLDGESYYICPKYGCIIYTIAMNDPNYRPGTSPTLKQLPPTYFPPAPAAENKLVWYGTTTDIIPVLKFDKADDPYHIPKGGQSCKLTEPALSGQ